MTTLVAWVGEILEDSERVIKYGRVHKIIREEKLINERMNKKIPDHEYGGHDVFFIFMLKTLF